MDWVIVEVVVGLAFLFFVISFVSSAIQEAIAGLFKLRARTLEKGVVNLLTGSSQSLRQALKEPGNAPSWGPPTDATSPTTGGTAPAPDAESSLASVDGLLRNF